MLAEDGILLAGHAELPWFCRYGFAASRKDGAFVLRKDSAPAASAARRPAPLRALHAPARPAVPVAPAARLHKMIVPTTPLAPTRPVLQAAAARPPSAAALLELARQCADAGQLDQALQHCEAALASQGELPEAFYLMGVVSASKGLPALAFDHWRRCVYLDPVHYEALCHLALLAFDNGDAKAADAYRQRAARVFAKRAANGGLA